MSSHRRRIQGFVRIVPIADLATAFIQGKAEGVAGMGYQSTDDRIFLVRISPIIHCYAAGRLPKEHYTRWVTLKACDILPDPLHGKSWVPKTKVPCRIWRSGETKDVGLVVQRDHDDVLGIREGLTIVERGVGIAISEASAIE